jgi:hypothetical protein
MVRKGLPHGLSWGSLLFYLIGNSFGQQIVAGIFSEKMVGWQEKGGSLLCVSKMKIIWVSKCPKA